MLQISKQTGVQPASHEEVFLSRYSQLMTWSLQMAGQNRDKAEDLVHDAYIRLVDVEKARHWDSRGHFFAAAAEAMRKILVDCARRKAALKRGGNAARVDFDKAVPNFAITRPDELLAVHDALDALAAEDRLTADLVKLHYFGGFALDEAADLLGMSRATAYRTWTYARTWLRAALRDAG